MASARPWRIGAFMAVGLECTIKGTPYGSFPPQLAEVTLYVGEGEEGKKSRIIQLPIFSLTPQAFLAIPPWTEPEKVEIGNETEIDVPLQNLLEDWPIRVDTVMPPSHKGIWTQADFVAKGKKEFAPFDVPSGLCKDRLVLRVVPNAGRALLKALLSPQSKGDPEKITASLEYRADLGLKEGLGNETLPVEIPVRFVSWPPLLILPLTFGTVLGSLLSLAAGQREKGPWLHAFGVSWLTALLTWLIAILLVQNDSEFRLLGFSLDPFQLLPAAIIGALLGLLGFRSLEVLRRLIPGLGKDASGQKDVAEKKS
jgi:hypothetical protein